MASLSLRTLRSPLRRALLALALPLAAGAAFAQAWPAKPITLIVPFPPGGPTDVASRIVAQKMSAALGQNIVIDNRSGASGTVGAAAAARAPADGYTFVMLATPTLLASHLYGPTGYDIFKNFTPVGSVYDLPIVLVVNPKALPEVTGLQGLIAKAKAENGKLNYTTAGAGSFGHLTTEQLKNIGKFEMQHVPYRGSAPALADVLAGHVPLMFDLQTTSLPNIATHKLKPLAVTGSRRSPLLPDVPTVAESGLPGFEVSAWFGVFAPAKLPPPVLRQLSAAMAKVLEDPALAQRLREIGAEPDPRNAAQFTAYVGEEAGKYATVVKTAGLAP